MIAPRLMVLHVWPEPGGFRAQLRELEPDSTQWFDDAQQLLAYLCAPQAAPVAPPPEPQG